MPDAQLTVRTGYISGTQVVLSSQGLSVGRGEDVDLRFDPQHDLRVSSRHAAFLPHEEGWILQDLESLNGTLVNGHPITAPVMLRDGDQIQLGEGGPLLEYRLLRGPVESAYAQEVPGTSEALRSVDAALRYPTHPSSSPEPPPPPPEPPSPSPPPESREARRVPGGVRRPVMILSAMLLIVMVIAFRSIWEGRRYRDQISVMQERIDSILVSSAEVEGALQGRIQGLHDALVESRENLESVRSNLASAEEAGDSDEIQVLRVRLQEAQAALVRHQLAANLDFDAIEAGNRRAVTKVFVDFGDEVITATAFSVRADATLMTNRHVVRGASGSRMPRRVAVQFADSRQVWPARVLAVSETDDLALLKIDNIVGEVPTISGFGTGPGAIESGQGVGVIGFPLGGAEPMGDTQGTIARTTLTAGIVQAAGPDLLEVNGYGVEGSSGSPVFDGEGRVVGVLFGGRVEGGERTLFAIPAGRAVAFLNGIG